MLSNLSLLTVLTGGFFVACVANEFKCTGTGRYPVPLSNCSSYYVCSTVNGVDFVASEQTCDDGLLFDETQKKCVPQSTYECPDIIDPCKNQTGRFPIPNTNCSSYYFCMKKGNGTVRAVYTCPIGSKFSSLSRRCERAYECPKADGTKTTPGSTIPSDETNATMQSNGTTIGQEPSSTTTSRASGEAITVESSTPPLFSETPTGSTSIENPTTDNSTPEASSTTTSENTTIWQTSEITSPKQSTSQNNVTTTELPQTLTMVPSTESSSPNYTSTTIVGIPSAPPNLPDCPANCIMCTKTGNYRIAEDKTSYVSCVRLDAMLFCGINKCDNGKVFCETSQRCIDRI